MKFRCCDPELTNELEIHEAYWDLFLKIIKLGRDWETGFEALPDLLHELCINKCCIYIDLLLVFILIVTVDFSIKKKKYIKNNQANIFQVDAEEPTAGFWTIPPFF